MVDDDGSGVHTHQSITPPTDRRNLPAALPARCSPLALLLFSALPGTRLIQDTPSNTLNTALSFLRRHVLLPLPPLPLSPSYSGSRAHLQLSWLVRPSYHPPTHLHTLGECSVRSFLYSVVYIACSSPFLFSHGQLC